MQEFKEVRKSISSKKDKSATQCMQCKAATCCPVAQSTTLEVRTEVVDGPVTRSFNDWPQASLLGRITMLKIWYGDVLSNIQIGYENKWLGIHPKTNAPQQKYIRIPVDDPLIKVSGVYGDYFGAQHFAQVVFTLKSGRTFGPFGSGQFMTGLTPFTLGGSDKEIIIAFFGGSFLHSDNSIFLSSLGVYIIKNSCGCPVSS